jgi:hypothetical protein
MALDQTTTSDERDAAERTYDPLWRNGLILRDWLEEADLINRDITKTSIGQFVIVSGDLSVLNAAIMRDTWVSPTLRALGIKQTVEKAQAKFEAENPANNAVSISDKAGPKSLERARAEAARTARKKQLALALEAAKIIAEINFDNLKYFPHSINCVITGNGFSVWSPLREEGITGAASDISLMHGSEVPGTWNLLGVLDALPSPIPAPEIVLPSDTPTHFAPNIKNFANMGRTVLGRSPEAYGMTALLLFREVTSGSTSASAFGAVSRGMGRTGSDCRRAAS